MKAPTIGVCGFGRCGSTMVMEMLAAGGVRPVDGSNSHSHELADITDAYRMTRSQLAGRSVKLLDAIIQIGSVPQADEWRFVWMDRNPVEQARSTVKFMTALGVRMKANAADLLAESYGHDRPRALGALRRLGPVVVLGYENVPANPGRAARRLRQLVPDLDVRAAAAVVHDRDGACRPDLAFEVRR